MGLKVFCQSLNTIGKEGFTASYRAHLTKVHDLEIGANANTPVLSLNVSSCRIDIVKKHSSELKRDR